MYVWIYNDIHNTFYTRICNITDTYQIHNLKHIEYVYIAICI